MDTPEEVRGRAYEVNYIRLWTDNANEGFLARIYATNVPDLHGVPDSYAEILKNPSYQAYVERLGELGLTVTNPELHKTHHPNATKYGRIAGTAFATATGIITACSGDFSTGHLIATGVFSGIAAFAGRALPEFYYPMFKPWTDYGPRGGPRIAKIKMDIRGEPIPKSTAP